MHPAARLDALTRLQILNGSDTGARPHLNISSSASASTNNTSHASSKGLSTGAEAGIGVGVALGVIALIAIAAILVLRRRRRRAGGVAGGPKGMEGSTYPEIDGTMRQPPELESRQPPQELEGTSHVAGQHVKIDRGFENGAAQ